MDAISTDRDNLSNSDRPPILIAASSGAARVRALRTIEASGIRVAAEVTVPEARERIERQVSASAIWVELDHDCGESLDELLTQVNRDAAAGRYAAVVSASPVLIDSIMACLEDSAVELIIDADDAERAAALAIATSAQGNALRVSDVASDRNAERLRQLSDEVSRIAATLARLSNGPSSVPGLWKLLPHRRSANAFGGHRTCRDPREADPGSLFPRRDVRRSCVGYAARPPPGRNLAAARARLESVHCRGRAGDDSAQMAENPGATGRLRSSR
jgi:hypothetical protein